MIARRAATAILVLLLAAGLGAILLVAARQPLGAGDYVMSWGLKARAIFRSGDLASVFRVDPEGIASHPDYPPLWPLVLAGFSRLAGRYDELWLSLSRPVLASLAAFMAYLATQAPRPFPLVSATAVLLLPHFRTPLYIGYAEGLLVLFLVAAVAASSHLDRGLLPRWGLALSLGCAALTKQEGLVAALSASVVLLAAGRRRDALRTFGLVAALTGSWFVFRAVHDTSRPLGDFALSAFSVRKVSVALGVLFDIGIVPNLAWVLGGLTLLALARGTRERRRGLLLALALHAVLLLSAFAFTKFDVVWLVTWTWDRLALPLVAVLLVVLSEAAAELLDDRRQGTC